MKKFIAIFFLLLGLVIGGGGVHYWYAFTGQRVARATQQKFAAVEQLKASAKLVTTEVIVKKMAVYDSAASEPLTISDPRSWRIGERMCVIPVEVTLKYGFDLSDLDIGKIKTYPEAAAVSLSLPPPRLLDSGYALLTDKEAYCYASTFAGNAGHRLQEQIRKEAYQAVLNDDILNIVRKNVEDNGRTLFKSILKSLGYKEAVVVINHE